MQTPPLNRQSIVVMIAGCALTLAATGCGTDGPDAGQLEIKEISPETIESIPPVPSSFPSGDWNRGAPLSKADRSR